MLFIINLIYVILFNLFFVPINFFLYKLRLINKLSYHNNIKEIIIKNGPIFIKYVQLLLIDKKNFNRYISLELIDVLTDLEDNIYKPQIYQNNLSINNCKIDIVKKSIASGSICAVYEFKYNDNTYILKTLHRNIARDIKIGYKLLGIYFTIIKYFSTKYKRIVNVIDMSNFRSIILQQTDMNLESKNIKIFNKLYGGYDIINIPNYIYNDNTNILMTKFEGYKLSEFIEKYPKYKLETYYVILSAIYIMIRKKVVHGDFHLGNILFVLDNGKVKINIIDFGLVFRITTYQSEQLLNYVETFKHKYILNFIKTINNNITDELYINRHTLFSKECDRINLVLLNKLKFPLELLNLLSILDYVTIFLKRQDINNILDFMITNDIVE
uniref:ABC1 atypical kinase-like domain-containing protein n=1 Tax=viral metagenome TaxID=1070528 RepID=A0A6C0IW56_9ZZZZ